MNRFRLTFAAFLAALCGILTAATFPKAAPVHSGLSQNQTLGYIADYAQGYGVATLPTAGPVHSGLSQNQLLGYIADYLQYSAPADAAGAIMARYPLVLKFAGYKSNCLQSAVFPLHARIGPGVVTFGGKYNSTSATGNNEAHVAISTVITPWATGAVPFGYNQLGDALLCSGSSAGTNVFPGVAQWQVSDATGTPAPGFITDPRSHRHVSLGHLMAGTIPAAPITTGGGISINAQWPLPTSLSGGARLPLVTNGITDDAIVLFPGNMSNLKLLIVCHGAGARAEEFINANPAGTGAITAATNYMYSEEPVIQAFLEDGWMVIASTGQTTTDWGNAQSIAMLDTLVDYITGQFQFSRIGVLSVSMGGLTGLDRLAKDSRVTHWAGIDAVCDIDAMMVTPSVTTGETRKRHTTFSTAITTAHGGAPLDAYNPMERPATVWNGKKMLFCTVGPDTTSTSLAEGCDSVVAPFYNSDALKTRATGAITTSIRGTNTSSAGFDHGRMGNVPVASLLSHFQS